MKTRRILLVCNWTSSENLCKLWDKMGDGNFSFTSNLEKIIIVWQPPFDYVFVVNSTTFRYPLNKTIYSIMEPVYNCLYWETVSQQRNKFFKAVWDFKNFTNQEWHLGKTRHQLLNEPIIKKYDKVISTVLSDKYTDPGHKLRIDFALIIQHIIEWHSFGGNLYGWKNYKGFLPPYKKDDAIFPYKYTFNVENHSIPGYTTEKLIDGILGECLVFYSGPPPCLDSNVIDPNAYVRINLNNFDGAIKLITRALNENWYEKKLPYIKLAKRVILNKTSFFPRLHNVIFN